MEFFGCADHGNGMDVARSLFEGALVLTPSLSFANMGQLAVDLLINSLLVQKQDIKHVGYLFSKQVLPMAGSPAFATQSTSGLCLNLEVYLLNHSSKKIVFVQQRTSILPENVVPFCNEFADWISTCGASQVIALCGVDNMMQHDANMSSTKIHWTCTEKTSSKTNEEFLKCIPNLSNEVKDDQSSVWSSVRGAGLAPLLFESCLKRSVSALAFTIHCAEGNNVPDAVCFASCVAQYLVFQSIPSFQLIPPPSWSQLFGHDPAIALYG